MNRLNTSKANKTDHAWVAKNKTHRQASGHASMKSLFFA